MADDQTIAFGKLGRPHGVRGELVLRPFNLGSRALDDLATPFPVEVVQGTGRRTFTVTGVRPMADHVLLRLEGVTSREAAAALTNAELWLARDLLPPLDEAEVYVQDLMGCIAVDEAGRERGVVTEVFWNGAHDVLTIVDATGEQLMLPAVPEFVREVDLEARRLVVDTHE